MPTRLKKSRQKYGEMMEELRADDPECADVIAEHVRTLGEEVHRWRTLAQALRMHLGIHPSQTGSMAEPLTLEQLYERLGSPAEGSDREQVEEQL